MGAVLPFVIASCRWTLKVFNKEIQAAASLSLAKFMLLRSVYFLYSFFFILSTVPCSCVERKFYYYYYL